MNVRLPSITNAKLPATYEAAKEALAQCSRIDECQEWADKAEALASYARQSKDDQLRKHADRIQARAVRRCGELLKTLDARGDHRKNNGTDVSSISQKQAATEAGLSQRQKETAVRVANVPTKDFEAAVESENPPTVTVLAEAGKKKRPLVDLGGRDLKDFSASTDGQAQLRQFAEFAQRVDASVVARGALPHERKVIRRHVAILDAWLDQLIVQLED